MLALPLPLPSLPLPPSSHHSRSRSYQTRGNTDCRLSRSAGLPHNTLKLSSLRQHQHLQRLDQEITGVDEQLDSALPVLAGVKPEVPKPHHQLLNLRICHPRPHDTAAVNTAASIATAATVTATFHDAVGIGRSILDRLAAVGLIVATTAVIPVGIAPVDHTTITVTIIATAP